MMSKRSIQQAVDVQGFGRVWRLSSGMTVEEALSRISDDVSWDAKLLVMETVEEGISLHNEDKITTDFGFRVKQRRVQAKALPGRRFGIGIPVDPDNFYYVPPNIDALVNDIKQGNYSILCGPRQSGKTTAVLAARYRLSVEMPDACVVHLGGGISDADTSWDSSSLWSCLAEELHMTCPMLFGVATAQESWSERKFRSLFLKTSLPMPVVLVLDEADTLLDLSPDCLDHLFHTIRMIKADHNLYNLHSILLVGVETVRDLLEAQYRHVTGAPGKSSPSRRSPFPHDHILPSTKFSEEDVVSLLSQAAADRPRIAVDVQRIGVSIMELTGGHKGLTGACLAYLVQEELWTLKQWIKHVESFSLKTYIFGQATYNRIMQFIRKHPQHKELLVKIVEEEEYVCDEDMVLKLRDFIAEGAVVVNKDEDTDRYCVSLSSPLLRSAILQKCVLSCGVVDSPPCATVLDREWVLLQAIQSLNGETMCKCLKAGSDPSEYAQQFLFMCRIKTILMQAYPLIPAVVVPEAKEIAVPGRIRKQLRLDTLVRDNDNFSKFGFELIANGTKSCIIEHVQRANQYHELHSAQVFVINFCMDKAREEIAMPYSDSVIFVSVNFKPSINSVRTTFVDRSGTRVVDSALRRWDGKISLDGLFA